MEKGALVTGLAFTGFLCFWRRVRSSRVQSVGDGVSDLILVGFTAALSYELSSAIAWNPMITNPKIAKNAARSIYSVIARQA